MRVRRRMLEKPDWLKPLYPWTQASVWVNGRRMAYLDEGPRRGRPVLLLHGNPTWSFLYRDFVDPLTAAGYRVIAPDCIGSGYSDKPRLDARLQPRPPHRRPRLADRPAGPARLRGRRSGLGRAAGRRRGVAAARSAGGAGPDEHLARHHLPRPLPHLAPAVDDLARADDRPVLPQAPQDALARRSVAHHAPRHDAGRDRRLPPRLRRA